MLTITGCRTTQKANIVLPNRPEREILPNVSTPKDMAETIIYYEYLIREWEVWADDVELLLKSE